MFLRDMTILQYHNVTPQFFLSDYWLSVDQFKIQMEFLCGGDYNIFSMDQTIAFMKKEIPDTPRNPIALTFDNGFLDFYRYAFPILDENDIQASVFISPKKVGSTITVNNESVSYMDWHHLQELSDIGLTIGAFEDSASALKNIHRKTVIRHLHEHKRHLEDRLGKEVRYFAVKEGVPDMALRDRMRKDGYSAFLTQCPTHTHLDLFAIGRIQVDDEDFNIFLTKISKSYLFFKDKRVWKTIRKYKLDRVAHHLSEMYNHRREKRSDRHPFN